MTFQAFALVHFKREGHDSDMTTCPFHRTKVKHNKSKSLAHIEQSRRRILLFRIG